MEPKQLTKGKLVQFFCSDFAKGMFTGLIANYLLFFFQPSPKEVLAGMPLLLPNTLTGFLTVMAIITLITKIVDAVSDPLVANWSDKTKNPRGRRMPFMQWSAIPYGLSCVLIFFAPFANESVLNAVWVAVFLTLYFIFYTFYSIPQRALIPEIITDPKKRVNAYSLSTVFFMAGSGVAYAAGMLVGLVEKGNVSVLWSWRIVFGIFGVIGIALLITSAFSIKEKDYLQKTNPPRESFVKSLKTVVKNRDFMIITFADLFNYIAMAFFQTTMFYYITDLIGLPKELSIAVLGPAIATAIIFFPLIIHVCKKYNKKVPLLIASGMFAVLFTILFFGDVLAISISPLALGICMGIVIAFPFAAINIIPQTMVADVIQEDTLRTGANREGMYTAAKTFLEKMSYAVAWFVVSIVLSIGAPAGETVGLLGIKITGPIAGGFALISFIILFFYNEKKIMSSISRLKDKKKSEEETLTSEEESSVSDFECLTETEADENLTENTAAVTEE